MNTLAAPRPAAAEPPAPRARVAGFRGKLRLAMMLVITGVTAVALVLAQRRLAATVERELEREFQAEFAALQAGREVRQAALVERCRALGRRPRIHAALEDGGVDLLYDAAQAEVGDLAPLAAPADGGLAPENASPATLRGLFYRFLGGDGAVIAPPHPPAAGALAPADEARLALPAIRERPQVGYLVAAAAEAPPAPTERESAADTAVAEVIATPIFSTLTGEPIGALVLGFRPSEFRGRAAGMRSGIWMGGRLHARGVSAEAGAALAPEIARAAAVAAPVRVVLGGVPQLLFAKALNPDSAFPPAYEVALFPLTELVAQQAQLRWQVLGAGGLLLLLGLAASHFASARLSAPVEKLAVDSERSARFSADASHQLKTPVTVLRAGLEELLAREQLSPEECHQISALIHQTYRLSSLIEDLLLLSRMDAGRMRLELAPVDLSALIEAALDDLSALPDELGLQVENEFPAGLHVLGEKRYTAIILQNLLENARKYNQPGGRIRLAARREGEAVLLTVANTGRPIAPEAQARIFERFHRGAIGENVPGYGLGLNLARELARLHGGELRLRRSDAEWTEFEVRLRAAGGAA